ncbi:MFS transporter [Paucilactobacillus wasatchensis]|uniref:Putative proline/betaine transporter n=1 Tax=Paucilactobacillus wasatchensis TaxID=1335616 RepID=A0A0D1A7H2_9LACO|nr:MFS transporter [Paucilactobacillus wasatchensis]KIS03830.1 transmembrane transport protein possibly for shikimate [Paucilactobacillus wasatchensis]
MQTTTEALPTTKSPTIERDPIKTVIFASMIGTAVEFFDFYAYGTAAATYFPKVFFPSLTPSIAILLSLLTFGVAFVARPLGSFIFGHYGDKIGRKKTLVVSLILMGGSTVLIGFLPSFASIGITSILLLCLCRFVQGIGLGGEWSGAVLVATENAPENKRALYGSFPELGAPLGFFLCNGLFFVLESFLSPAQMISFGWRIPFLASAVMVFIGLWVRKRLQETPLFRKAQTEDNTVKSPLKEVFKTSWKQILRGTFIVAVSYTFFFTLSTWSLTFATTNLGFNNREFLLLLMAAIVMFAGVILASSYLADKWGRKKLLMSATAAIAVFAVIFPYFLTGQHNVPGVCAFLFIGFFLMGLVYGPIGAVLPELFTTKVRYSGSALAYNLSAIVGAAFAPTIATWLAENWGLHTVGLYLGIMAVVSFVALAVTKETKHVDYTK